MFFPTPRPEFSFQIVNSNRENYSMLVQLITGHNYAKRHQNIIDKANGVVDPFDRSLALCPLCEEDEASSLHLLAECVVLGPIRLRIFGQHRLAPPFGTLKKAQLVCFLRAAPITALKFFIEE